MKNFGELKNDVAVLCQRSGDADYLTKIGVWLQLSHKTLTEVYDYWRELKGTFNFSSVASQASYALPNNFDKPFRLYDLTNNTHIDPITEEEYSDSNIANISASTTGIPNNYMFSGVRGSTTAIASTGDTTQVKSSSASDTGAIVIRIEGYLDSAKLILGYENITVSTGAPTTFVAGTTTFYEITHISKSVNTVGYITIANSSGTTIEFLAPNDRVARHFVLKFGLIPTSVYSYRMLYKKTIPELYNDYDYPFTECDRYLTMDALGWALKQDTKDQQAELAWDKAANALRALLNNQSSQMGPDYQHKIVSKWLTAHRTI